MSKTAISRLMLTLLLIGMLTLTYSLQSVSSKLQGFKPVILSELEANDEGVKNESIPIDFDFRRLHDLKNFAHCINESVEIVVGTDFPKAQMQKLTEIILEENGKVTETIYVGENIKAIKVLVPINYSYVFVERLKVNKLVRYVEPNLKVKAYYTPNDPCWSSQWGPKKIEADAAWDTDTGSSNVLVAIVDTGIDYTHTDLVANYIPLGYDWVNNDADPMDDDGHGTHCAGIIAAELNNSIGIVGLAQVRIIAEKVLDRQGNGYEDWVANGIVHATDQGANIISMSLGGNKYSALIHDAVKYACGHGVLLVAAAGNSGEAERSWPAAYDEVVAVTATDQNDNPASFTSFGDWVEIAAPGVDIFSTLPSNSYELMSGTSMACPHVAGVAALVWSVFPNYDREQIRLLLRLTADDLGDLGFDPYYGYGRINARRAVGGLPEHDIGMIGWQHPRRLDPGQCGVFNVTIYNFGRNFETNISMQSLINETLINSVIIGFLQSYASETVSFSWNTTMTGVFNVTSYLVSVSGENYTENNVVSADVLVRFPNTFRVPDDYQTIKGAVNISLPGDTILVRHGYYAEGQIDISTCGVSLVADGEVTLDGLDADIVLNVIADYVIMKGFTIQNGNTSGIKVEGHSNTLEGNTISHNYGGIHLVHSSNCTISLNNISSNEYYGIKLDTCSQYNSIIENNVTENTMCGVFLKSSLNNIVIGNNITNTGEGVYLLYSSDNIITGSKIVDNDAGIGLTYSNDNSLAGNNITNKVIGVSIRFSSDNILTENNITNNEIIFLDTFGCRIYHNNIRNSIIDTWGLISIWDYGYLSGGNYWSNYNGIDIEKGPNQDQFGSDGIGDTPYIIDTNNRDNYPLMKPYPLASHDIGITSVTTSRSVIGHGYNTTINVMAFNYGNYTESINIKIYASETIIGEINDIEILNRSFTIVSFEWNTSGFASESYIISAYVEPVPGETDIVDNRFVNGIVKIFLLEGPYYTWWGAEYWIVEIGKHPIRLVSNY